MKFCSQCGNSVAKRIPEGDTYERHVCDDCGVIHYQNPKIIVGCLPVYGDQVLLCKRAIEPRLGFWTLPAGFMENGETTQHGALRETWEEAKAKPVIDDLYTLFNLPHINQVYMFYLARLSEPEFASGDESLEVELFNEDEIPWDNLAFPVVNETLKYYFDDRKVGKYPIRVRDIERRPRKTPPV